MSHSQRIFPSTRAVYVWTALIFVVCLVLFVVPFVVAHGRQSIRMHLPQLLLAVALVYAHELLHVVGFRAFGGVGRRDISLRMSWRYLMPHVELRTAVSARRWRVAALMPGVVTGLVPLVVGLALGSGQTIVLGALMTAAAGGDVAIVAALRGFAPDDAIEANASWAAKRPASKS